MLDQVIGGDQPIGLQVFEDGRDGFVEDGAHDGLNAAALVGGLVAAHPVATAPLAIAQLGHAELGLE